MSTADFLGAQARVDHEEGERLRSEIERLEELLVSLRGERDEMFRRAAEMRAAANILREVGLRSEMTAKGPVVAVDYTPKRPETTA